MIQKKNLSEAGRRIKFKEYEPYIFNKEISQKIKKGEDWYKVDKNGEITKIETE